MAREMKDSGIEWVGQIPQEWFVLRIKNLKNGEVDSFQDGDWIESPFITDQGIRYLTTGNVGDGRFKRQGNGYITEETFRELNCKYAYPNDLVISRLNAPYGRACILPDDEKKYVLAVDLVILRTDNDKRFLCYLMQCVGYQNEVQDGAKGTTMKRISRTNLGNIRLPIAPVVQQHMIADFLDAECARIDAVIEQTRASIEEYKKLKQSVITEAVTKGIRPGRKMKDSGIEWIGEVPEEWEVRRLQFIITTIESGTSVNAGQNAATEGELGVLKTSAVSKNVFLADENKSVNKEEVSRVSCPVKGNTIIVSRMNTPDLVGACGYVNKDYDNLFLPDRLWQVSFKSGTNVKYVYYWLIGSNIRNYYSSLAVGTSSSMQNISQDQFYHAYCPLPSRNEQDGIVNWLDIKTQKIDSLIAYKEKLLMELESYKKSLIFEYVTGKKEVFIQNTYNSICLVDMRALLMCRIIELMKPKGRIHLMKALYCVDCLSGVNTETQYYRWTHGPYDDRIEEYEKALAVHKWVKIKSGNPVTYILDKEFENYRDIYLKYYSQIDDTVKRICDFLAPMRTSQAERSATLLAVWNDFIVDGLTPTDDQIIHEVRTNWTPNKANSSEETWRDTLEKIKRHNLIPRGLARHTVVKVEA